MPRGRGGARQGTPGKGYANRTDLQMKPDMAAGSPAAGGMEAPRSQQPVMPVYPEDIPDLSSPTSRPDEPISAGLPVGPGPGMEAMTGMDPRLQETRALKKWLPLLKPIGEDPETPDSVRALLRYIRGS